MTLSILPLWQRWILVSAITLVVGFPMVEFRQRGMLQPLELVQYDWTTSALAETGAAADVYLVAISDQELRDWGWPVPDNKMASLVTSLLANGARAVGVDIYRDIPAGEGREDLIEVLSDPRVVVISKLPASGSSGIDAPQTARAGFSDIPIDADGVARRALLLVNSPNGIALSLPLQLAATYSGQRALESDPDNPRYLSFGNTVVRPLTAGSNLFRTADTAGYQIIIDYQNALPIAQRVSAKEVLANEKSARFDGKVAIIGVTSHSVKDYFSTPLNRSTGANFAFGAEIHAAIVQQLIDYSNGQLSPLRSLSDRGSSWIVLLSVFAGSCLAVFIRHPSKAIFLLLCGGVLLSVGLSYLQAFALLMPAAPAVLGWFLGFLMGFSVIAAISRNQRRAIVQIFSSHLSDELSAEIWQQRKNLLSGGKPRSRRLFVTTLFADIEQSTRIGNAMDAGEFMVWISRILDRLGEIARDHGGFVEKYTGDGILVVFGAPIPSDTPEEKQEDAISGLRCAQAMREAAAELNNLHGDQPVYRLRVALNSGEALGGTLGVRGSMHYNVIGDTINVAARLENRIKSLAPDADGFRPICMTMATAKVVDSGRDWPVLFSFKHDDGETEIQVVEVLRPSPE